MIRCVVRGGGDLATGVVWRLFHAGVAVVVTELAKPLTIRRTVAVSSAVGQGCVDVESLHAVRVDDWGEVWPIAEAGTAVPVIVAPELPADHSADVVVDARLAKTALDTTIDDAPLVVALGPGFEVGVHCHAVVETVRGHHLGRVLWSGAAAPNTGTPGMIGGYSAERVVRAPFDGMVTWHVAIGDIVEAGDGLGQVGSVRVVAPIGGVVRGLIAPGTRVRAGLKIGDIDPRADRSACFEISDKALAIGGGVVEAVLSRR